MHAPTMNKAFSYPRFAIPTATRSPSSATIWRRSMSRDRMATARRAVPLVSGSRADRCASPDRVSKPCERHGEQLLDAAGHAPDVDRSAAGDLHRDEVLPAVVIGEQLMDVPPRFDASAGLGLVRVPEALGDLRGIEHREVQSAVTDIDVGRCVPRRAPVDKRAEATALCAAVHTPGWRADAGTVSASRCRGGPVQTPAAPAWRDGSRAASWRTHASRSGGVNQTRPGGRVMGR